MCKMSEFAQWKLAALRLSATSLAENAVFKIMQPSGDPKPKEAKPSFPDSIFKFQLSAVNFDITLIGRSKTG